MPLPRAAPTQRRGPAVQMGGVPLPRRAGRGGRGGEIQNYIAFRGRVRYDYAKTQNQPASTSEFAFEDATVFYGGPFEKRYGAFFELEREAENAVELTAHIATAWGKENAYGGFRIGQMHWLQRWGLAGFDRPVGIRTPTPVSGAVTAALPFAFAADQLGLEAYSVAGGKNRLSAQLLNGVN